MIRAGFIASGLGALALSGCVSYEKNPLVPVEIVREIEMVRRSIPGRELESLTFQQVAEVMSRNSPELERIRARYLAVQSIANISTPWPNPSLEAGVDLGSGLGPGVTGKTRPFVGLGFTIPLGGKLSKNDSLNEARALRALVEVQAQHRELYLELRQTYTGLYLVHRKRAIQNDLLQISNTMLKIANTLMAAGAGTALDVGMIELEANQAALELLEVESELATLESTISMLLGIDASHIGLLDEAAVPPLGLPLPGYEILKTALIDNHMGLARLRFDHEIAEMALRLEVAKQYPDLRFGVERKKEVGGQTTVLGLRLGIDIPLFDQNRQGIAQASQDRETVRKDYGAMVHRALSALKLAQENIRLNQQREFLLEGTIKPRAQANLNIAKQALESGGLDALKYLDVLRTYQQTMKEVALIEGEVRTAWFELEAVVGAPVLLYPGEKTFSISLESDKKIIAEETSNER